jgi:hypothetical protein
MTKLNRETIRIEMEKWVLLKKSIDKTPNGKIQDFGKQMNTKYNLGDKQLEEEKDHNMSLLLLISKHVQKETSI